MPNDARLLAGTVLDANLYIFRPAVSWTTMVFNRFLAMIIKFKLKQSVCFLESHVWW